MVISIHPECAALPSGLWWSFSVLQYECSARNSIKAYIRSSEICSAQTQALIKFINYIVIIYTMNGMKIELKLVIADSLHETSTSVGVFEPSFEILIMLIQICALLSSVLEWFREINQQNKT